MRVLKILVVVMGVLLVIGFAALIAGIAGRMSRDRPGASVERPFAASAIDIPSLRIRASFRFSEIRLTKPARIANALIAKPMIPEILLVRDEPERVVIRNDPAA